MRITLFREEASSVRYIPFEFAETDGTIYPGTIELQNTCVGGYAVQSRSITWIDRTPPDADGAEQAVYARLSER